MSNATGQGTDYIVSWHLAGNTTIYHTRVTLIAGYSTEADIPRIIAAPRKHAASAIQVTLVSPLPVVDVDSPHRIGLRVKLADTNSMERVNVGRVGTVELVNGFRHWVRLDDAPELAGPFGWDELDPINA